MKYTREKKQGLKQILKNVRNGKMRNLERLNLRSWDSKIVLFGDDTIDCRKKVPRLDYSVWKQMFVYPSNSSTRETNVLKKPCTPAKLIWNMCTCSLIMSFQNFACGKSQKWAHSERDFSNPHNDYTAELHSCSAYRSMGRCTPRPRQTLVGGWRADQSFQVNMWHLSFCGRVIVINSWMED